MASSTSYHFGGFNPAAPQQNRAEHWDSTTGYTRWNEAGVQQEQRALTAGETANFAAQDTATTADVNNRDMRTKLTNALDVNATYLALATPTAAQNLSQIRALTRECNALIRIRLDMLADTTGT